MRVTPARTERQQALVQAIADIPGQSRADLAGHLCVSIRQVQEELLLIRHGVFRATVELELVRDRGYRFRIRAIDRIEGSL